MRQLTISAGKRGTTILELCGVDGSPIERKTYDFDSVKSDPAFEDAAVRFGISKPELLKALKALRDGSKPVTVEVPDVVEAARVTEGMQQRQAVTEASFKAGLQRVVEAAAAGVHVLHIAESGIRTPRR